MKTSLLQELCEQSGFAGLGKRNQNTEQKPGMLRKIGSAAKQAWDNRLTPDEKFQKKIEKRVASRRPDTPAQRRRDAVAAKQQQSSDKINNRSMTKDEYQQQRRNKRAYIGDNDTTRATTNLVPLVQADEMKIRQMMKRLNPAQASELAKHIADIAKTTMSIHDTQALSTSQQKATETLSIGTFKDSLLLEIDDNSDPVTGSGQRALQTLKKWGEQLAKHPGKFGTLMMLISELEFQDAAHRVKFKNTIEQMFGTRYTAKATNAPNKRMTKNAVKQRGRDAGPTPKFRTRADAREFTKDQNTFKPTRKVADAGRDAADRWSSTTV